MLRSGGFQQGCDVRLPAFCEKSPCISPIYRERESRPSSENRYYCAAAFTAALSVSTISLAGSVVAGASWIAVLCGALIGLLRSSTRREQRSWFFAISSMCSSARRQSVPRHARGRDRRAHRWGKTKGKIGFHGGKVEIERPRLRGFDGKEQPVPSWEAAVAEDWLGKWALNQMLINVATRKFARSVRLPEGDVPGPAGAGLSKSAASRRFVALSAARMKDWMASDLSGLDLLVIQIDGIYMDEDLILVAAIGVDAKGDKHPGPTYAPRAGYYQLVRLAGCSHVCSTPAHEVPTSAHNVYETLRDK